MYAYATAVPSPISSRMPGERARRDRLLRPRITTRATVSLAFPAVNGLITCTALVGQCIPRSTL
jgi:hypothetical protein